MKRFLIMNIALFTSNYLRHRYIAAKIADSLPLRLIVTEEKSSVIEQTINYTEEDVELIRNHFEEREVSEQLFFGKYQDFPGDIPLVVLKHGTINSESTIKLLKENEIDCILLFGTSIIRNPILDAYQDKIINLHLGLSPYYKGTGTNFFPIVNNEFECIGATIHIATSKVDAGAILHQLRLNNISETDSIHSLGNKVILDAGKIYPEIVSQYINGKIKLFPQKNNDENKVYRLKDFTPKSLRKAKKVIKDGGLSEFIKNKKRKQILRPIIIQHIE